LIYIKPKFSPIHYYVHSAGRNSRVN